MTGIRIRLITMVLLRTVISFFLLFWFLHLTAQNNDELYDTGYRPFVTFRNILLADDYLFGLELGAISPAQNLTFFSSFDMRPYRKKLLNYQGGNLFYQNAEQRFFIGLGAEYLQYMREKNYGVFIQLNGNYTWAYYGGTELKPPGGLVLNPKAGFFWNFTPDLFLKGGYAYQDTSNEQADKNRLYVAVSGIIHIRKD